MHNHSQHYVEAALGAVGEMIRRSGHKCPHQHGAGKLGEWAVQGIAKIAPGLVATGAAATGTALTTTGTAITAAATTAGAAALAAAPFVAAAAATAAAGYGIYRFAKWASE